MTQSSASAPATTTPSLDTRGPLQYLIARGEIGVKERAGDADNPRVIEYLSATRLPKRLIRDETAWCSAFVNWCMMKANVPRTNKANALSWLTWGVPLNGPTLGCVVVFNRHVVGKPDGVHGHVAFFVRIEGDNIVCLGGYQHNEVCEARYPLSRLLAYRGPATV